MKNRKNRKAFTLIELLVVIAIIAVLSVVVILSLNPAELLRQSRDSNRISDMATLKSALSLYLADQSSISLGTNYNCYVSAGTTNSWYTPSTTGTVFSTPATTCTVWMVSSTAQSESQARGVTGSGWIPVNFSAISAGTPIGSEPLDPTNTTGTSATSKAYFYSYEASGTVFKLASIMESIKYSTGGTGDVETGDGGQSNYVYEQGTNLAL